MRSGVRPSVVSSRRPSTVEASKADWGFRKMGDPQNRTPNSRIPFK